MRNRGIQRGAALRYMATAVACAMLPALAGCSPRPEACALPRVRCAGLVTEFGGAETGLAGEAWRALADARNAGLVDRIDAIETVDTRDREANVLALATLGYDVIVTVGPGMAESTKIVARRFPEQRFVGVQQTAAEVDAPSNYITVEFHEERSGYLAGAVAGLLTRTDHVAAVCESEFIDSMRETCEGFRQGAEDVKPNVDVDVLHRAGSNDLVFRDTDWGRAAALRGLEAGADVVFAIGGETAEAALITSAQGGAMVIGGEVDRFEELPEIQGRLVTSAVLEVRAAVLQAVTQALSEGEVPDSVYGEVGLAPFREFEDRLPAGVMGTLAKLVSDLNSGTIVVQTTP